MLLLYFAGVNFSVSANIVPFWRTRFFGTKFPDFVPPREAATL